MAEIEYEYLDVRDKNNIIINHIRSVEYNMYNLEIQKVLANSSTHKDQSLLDSLEQELIDAQAKITELKSLIVNE